MVFCVGELYVVVGFDEFVVGVLSCVLLDVDVYVVLCVDYCFYDVVKFVVCCDVVVCMNVGVEVGVGVEIVGELVGIFFFDKILVIEGVILGGGLVVVECIVVYDIDEGWG